MTSTSMTSALDLSLKQILAKANDSPKEIAQVLASNKLSFTKGLASLLQQSIGNEKTKKVMSELGIKPSPLLEQNSEEPKEPKTSTESNQSLLRGESTDDEPVLAVAPKDVFRAVGETFKALGFAAEGQESFSVSMHFDPQLTEKGFNFKSARFGGDGQRMPTSKVDSVDTGYSEGMQKKHATAALVHNDGMTLNPLADISTLVHEIVHLYQKGQFGRMFYEAMTDIIAAMAFERLAEQKRVKGTYNYAPAYLPWIVFVSEVIAPKIGWDRLVGYYVGQGITEFEHLAVELGFHPTSTPMSELKDAFEKRDIRKAEKLRTTILNGPEQEKDKPKKWHKSGASLANGKCDMSSVESWLKTFEKLIEDLRQDKESNSEVAQRVAATTTREALKRMLKEADEHLKTAKDQTLRSQIVKCIEDAKSQLSKM